MQSPSASNEPSIAPVLQTEERIRTSDGWTLGATVFTAQGAGPKRVAIVGAAIGAKRGRYFPFARHLARLGWHVVTFTYRGLGDSERGDGAPDPTLVDWGRTDLTAVIDWTTRQLRPDYAVAVLHSISGQLIGLARNHERLAAAAAISTPRHLWSLWRGPYRYVVYGFFRLLIPIALLVRKRLRLSVVGLHDLPPAVAQQWARTGLFDSFDTNDYRDAIAGFERLLVPTVFVSFEDDRGIAPGRTVEYLRGRLYAGTYTEHVHVRPETVGATAIGHSGFFDGQVDPKWWTALAERLEALATKTERERCAYSDEVEP